MGWKDYVVNAWYTIPLPIMTLVGFFGTQAIRMLRESWDGTVPITTDPISQEQQVRPVGADLLAQELFSMLNDNTPQTQNAPVTLNQAPGAQGLTINSSGSTTDPAVLNVTSGNITLAGNGTVSMGTPSSATTTGSTVVLMGNSLVIPPIGQLPLAATTYDPLSPTELPTINLGTLGNASPGQVYMGEVTAHLTGNDYTVTLAGITGSVTATISTVGSGYVVPNGTFTPVVVVDDGSGGILYEFQTYPYAPASVTGLKTSIATNQGLSTLYSQLEAQGIITDDTSGTTPNVAGSTMDMSTNGLLWNLLLAMGDTNGFVTRTSANTTAPTFGGAIQDVSSTSGGLYNLWLALYNYGIVGTSPATNYSAPSVTGSRSDGGNEIPALKSLLSVLAARGHITDNTSYP